MLNPDRAMAKAEALFKKNDETTEAAAAQPSDGTPERRRRRIVRQVPTVIAADGSAQPAQLRREGDERRSAREILRLLSRKEPALEEALEEAPEPVVPPVARPRRRVVKPVIAASSAVFQLEVEVLVSDSEEPETVVLVIRGADMAGAVRSTLSRVEAWMDERRPGAEWRMTAIELLPDLLV